MDECTTLVGAPNTGGLYTSPVAISLVVGVAALILIGLLFIILRSARGHKNIGRTLLSITIVSALAASVMFSFTSVSAADSCDEQNTTGGGDTTSQAIAAIDDSVKPQGSFATNSPYAFGWQLSLSSFYDGTTSRNSISGRVVDNDTGNLNTNTVDLAPGIPGVQQEVVVLYSDNHNDDVLKYTYDPITDLVSISAWNAPDDFDQTTYEGAKLNFRLNYFAANGVYPSSEEENTFAANYLTAEGIPAVTATVTYDEAAAAMIKSSSEDWAENSNVSINAFEIRVPYTVQATDGSGSTGADIVLPVFAVYMIAL